MANSEAWSQIELDSRKCLTLKQILHAFSAPISEHHAWAITYQAIKCLQTILETTDNSTVKYMAVSSRDIVIHKDGFIHPDTFLCPGLNRNELTSEVKVMEELGMVVYEALDYTMQEESQRELATDLEVMFETMTDIDSDDEGDEGIDDCELGNDLMKQIVELCKKHLDKESHADEHYSGVCRALVTEALDISSFIQKVKLNEASNDDELIKLGLQDWSSIWRQLLQELRNGIKLKKVDYSKTATEFELTPYEILMDDIRAKKYKLNPVKISPKVRKDAVNEILEFIMSRPPLKSASMRVLNPKPITITPAEQLFEDIRKVSTKKSLRKIKTNVNQNEENSKLTKKRGKIVYDKKIIDLDEELVSDLLNFGIDDDNDCDSSNSEEEIIDLTTSPLKEESHEPPQNKLTKSVSDGNLLRPSMKLSPSTPSWNKTPRSSLLTLEEFCHIQVNMDNASLASLDTITLREDLTKGKVCFRCKSSRFGMFTWSTECFVCGRLICSKCLTSLVIPNRVSKDVPLLAFISPKETANCNSPCYTPTIHSSLCHQKDPHTPLSTHSEATSPTPQTISPKLPSPRFGMSRTSLGRCKISPSRTSPGKCKVSPNHNCSIPAIVTPTFKRAKTMSKAEGSARKAKMLLAMNSGFKQYVCKHCVEMMTHAVTKETMDLG